MGNLKKSSFLSIEGLKWKLSMFMILYVALKDDSHLMGNSHECQKETLWSINAPKKNI